MQILGLRREPPPHVQHAIDVSDAMDKAVDDAQSAVGRYWRDRRTEDAARGRSTVDDYADAETRRGGRG